MTDFQLVALSMICLCLSDLAELRGKRFSSLAWALGGLVCGIGFFIGHFA